MTKFESIEAEVMSLLRQLNKNVPVTKTNQADILIFAIYLETCAHQLRQRVRDFRTREMRLKADNDNKEPVRMSH